MRIVEREHGGEVVVLTLGPPEAEEQLRDAWRSAPTGRSCSQTDGEEWDAQATAGGDRRGGRGARRQPFDLILFGNESADGGNFQVGIRVAEALGRPVVTGVKAIAVAEGTASAASRRRRAAATSTSCRCRPC